MKFILLALVACVSVVSGQYGFGVPQGMNVGFQQPIGAFGMQPTLGGVESSINLQPLAQQYSNLAYGNALPITGSNFGFNQNIPSVLPQNYGFAGAQVQPINTGMIPQQVGIGAFPITQQYPTVGLGSMGVNPTLLGNVGGINTIPTVGQFGQQFPIQQGLGFSGIPQQQFGQQPFPQQFNTQQQQQRPMGPPQPFRN